MNALEKQVVRSFARLQDAADAVDDIREMCDAVCAERDSFADELVRMRLAFKQLVDSFAKPGASVDVRISGCEWCGEMWPRTEGQTREVTLEAARFHLSQCKEHPLVKRLANYEAVVQAAREWRDARAFEDSHGDFAASETKQQTAIALGFLLHTIDALGEQP